MPAWSPANRTDNAIRTAPGQEAIGIETDLTDASALVAVQTADEADPEGSLPPEAAGCNTARWRLR